MSQDRRRLDYLVRAFAGRPSSSRRSPESEKASSTLPVDVGAQSLGWNVSAAAWKTGSASLAQMDSGADM